MFSILRDSLFDPKKIITYKNTKTSKAILYLFILALLMSAGPIVAYLRFDSNSVITSETTGCSIESARLVCEGTNHDANDPFYLYDYTFYFLDESESVNDISMIDSYVMVFQGTDISIYQSQELYLTWSISSILSMTTDFDAMIGSFQSGILSVSIFLTYFSDVFLIFFFVLISSLPYLSIRKYYSYGMLFRLTAYAITPSAAVFAFYSLINMPEMVFWILLIGSFYASFIMRRSLSEDLYSKTHPEQPSSVNSGDEESTEEENDENNDL